MDARHKHLNQVLVRLSGRIHLIVDSGVFHAVFLHCGAREITVEIDNGVGQILVHVVFVSLVCSVVDLVVEMKPFANKAKLFQSHVVESHKGIRFKAALHESLYFAIGHDGRCQSIQVLVVV